MKTDTPKPPAETVRDRTVRTLALPIDKYVDWACEQGLYLPPGFETDPTGWNEVLRSIQRAFSLLYKEQQEYGELWTAKMKWKEFGEQDTEEINALNKEVATGLANFGKHLFYLTDVIVDRGPSH
jgi:hypothetical protein